MFKYLHIRNFALAENLQIDFQPGLNILTGETGTGKSILVGAIAAVLGGRVYSEVIRTGFDKAFVEAVFDVSALPGVRGLLESKGIVAADELFLRRELSLASSSRAFINDMPVTVGSLAELGDLLLDIHGQHEHQSLLRRETHRHFLDGYGQLSPQLELVAEKYHHVKLVEKSLRELRRRQNELESKHELYEFQFQEIEKAALKSGEEEELLQERKLLANVEKISGISAQLNELFSEGEFNLLESISRANYHLRELSEYAEDLKKLCEEFAGAKIVVEETARSIEEFRNRLEFDPRRLEEVEARLNLITQLKKKYGATIEEILSYQNRIKEALNLRENYDFEIEKLTKQYSQALAEYCREATVLSQQRRQVADRMETLVQEKLKLLGMPDIRFKVNFERQEDSQGIFLEGEKSYFADEYGVDQLEFYISPNPGEDFKPLSKIASGGEISRIMLALKSILATVDEIPTLVFDEIDMGVSGRIAQAVGRSIHQLSKSHQILCITHLPQIASHGEVHFSVEKYVEDGRTFTRIIPLNENQRVEEIARLMAGEKITETVLNSARQLLDEARQN
jgi:DNA repair protein RecN (Recombination protein N)